MEMKRFSILLAVVLALVLLLPACGTPALTAQQILEKTFANMSEVNTVSFTMTEDMSFMGQTMNASASGYSQPPDKSYSTLTMSYGGTTYTTETLQVGPGEVYMRMSGDPSWTLASADQTATTDNAIMFYAKADPEQAKQWYLNPVLQGIETADGVRCYKLAYELDAETAFEQILSGLAGSLESAGVTITPGESTGVMYIGVNDFLVYKNTGTITMTIEVQGASVDLAVDIEAHFTDFNKPVTFPTP
jgi:hypothetical protein